MSKKIDSHLIEQRLRLNSHSSDDYMYEEHSDPPPETESSIFTPSFIATVLSLMVFTGMGSFFLGGGVIWSKGGASSKFNAETFVSSVQADCGAFWKKGLRDDTGLSCYLTQKVQRLCQPEERQHLVFVIEQWSASISRYNARRAQLNAKAGASLIFNQREIIEFSRKADSFERRVGAGERDVPVPNADRDLAFMKDLKNESRDISAMIKKPILEKKRLANELNQLAMAGYIKRDDFKWIPDSFVEEAFTNLPAVVRSNCTP